MALILENARIAEGVYRMRLGSAPTGRAGQFVMLRQPGVLDPFLGRPISLFDADAQKGELKLLYQTAGRGTAMFSALLPGQQLEVQGPYGNGFPLLPGDAVLIGGGIGAAPLYLLARELRASQSQRRIAVFLGFREEAYLEDAFSAIADTVQVNIGGFVTADVDFSRPATYYACGPAPMLRAAASAAEASGATLYVSLEKHMACGVGACLGCTCKTANGNKRVCKDGPVFIASEVRDVL